jgi:hypothetical protein
MQFHAMLGLGGRKQRNKTALTGVLTLAAATAGPM